METCQSGLTYLFAKEAGCKSPREFESRRLRQIEYRTRRVGGLIKVFTFPIICYNFAMDTFPSDKESIMLNQELVNQARQSLVNELEDWMEKSHIEKGDNRISSIVESLKSGSPTPMDRFTGDIFMEVLEDRMKIPPEDPRYKEIWNAITGQ
jgi:hypothetical protein